MTIEGLRQRIANRIRRRDNDRSALKALWERIRKRRRSLRRNSAAIRKLRELVKLLLSRPTVMYDSITVGDIPANAPAVAGYVNGRWPTYGSIRREFPNAKHLSIAVTSSADAQCLDIEPGNAVPSDAPAWVKRQKARGVALPVVYAAASQMPKVLRALADAGISRSEVRVWTAHYGAGKHLCGPTTCGYLKHTTADATQWTDRSQGRNLDESVLKRSFFQ